MNIDDEIKKLNEERDGLLAEIVKKRTRVNELARKIRSLETVKRHASEILDGDDKTLMISGDGPGIEDEVKDPAQLDLEIDNPSIHARRSATLDGHDIKNGDVGQAEIVGLPNYEKATKAMRDRENIRPIEVEGKEEEPDLRDGAIDSGLAGKVTPFEKAIKEAAAENKEAIDDFLKS